MPTAAIFFTQGLAFSTPGVALLVSSPGLGTPVVAANGSVAASYQWFVVDVPPGSAVPVGPGPTTPTFTFTPDVTGCYLLTLTVKDAAGNAATDTRAFGVREADTNFVIPPFGAVTSVQSPLTGSLNWFDSILLLGAQNKRGWAPYQEQIDRAGGAVVGGPGLTTAPSATGTTSLVGGDGATDNGNANAIALGPGAQVTGTNAIAVGVNANAAASGTAVGQGSTADAGGVAVGNAQATGNDSVAVGQGSTATNVRGVAVGSGASSAQVEATALGPNATASAANATALTECTATRGGQLAYGVGLPTSPIDLNERSQMSAIVLGSVAPTPGSAPGESVLLQDGASLDFTAVDGRAYVMMGWVLARGYISGILKVRAWFKRYLFHREAGVTTLTTDQDVIASAGDAGAANWTVTASIGAAPDRLLLTFSTGPTQARVDCTGSFHFMEV